MIGVRCIFTGKRQYPTKVLAMAALRIARALKRGGDRRRDEARAYHCQKFGAWHLTSRRNPGGKRKPAPAGVQLVRGAPR